MYIVGYTFGNHVLRLRAGVAVKLNFRPYIQKYTSPNENFEYSYPLIIVIIIMGQFMKFWYLLLHMYKAILQKYMSSYKLG